MRWGKLKGAGGACQTTGEEWRRGIREEKRGTQGGKGLSRGLDRSGTAAATPEHPLPGVSLPSPRLGAGEPGVQERKMHKANIF